MYLVVHLSDPGCIIHSYAWLPDPGRGSNNSTFKNKKNVFHIHLVLVNHRKGYIKTHTHTHENIHALFWQGTHTHSSQKLIEYLHEPDAFLASVCAFIRSYVVD